MGRWEKKQFKNHNLLWCKVSVDFHDQDSL